MEIQEIEDGDELESESKSDIELRLIENHRSKIGQILLVVLLVAGRSLEYCWMLCKLMIAILVTYLSWKTFWIVKAFIDSTVK